MVLGCNFYIDILLFWSTQGLKNDLLFSIGASEFAMRTHKGRMSVGFTCDIEGESPCKIPSICLLDCCPTLVFQSREAFGQNCTVPVAAIRLLLAKV